MYTGEPHFAFVPVEIDNAECGDRRDGQLVGQKSGAGGTKIRVWPLMACKKRPR